MDFRISAAGLTDVGLKRDHNEDNFLLADDLGLFLVADGMGGHAAGEVASHTAVSAMASYVRRAEQDGDITLPAGEDARFNRVENLLRSALTTANREVCRASEKNLAYGGMGTTLAAVYVRSDRVYVLHVGDSRVYLLREGKLLPLTQDHSWVNEQVQRNIITEEEARSHRWRNVITRALGNRDEVEGDIRAIDPRPGDLFLICSDGLTSMVSDETIQNILAPDLADLDELCQKLVRLANEAGGLDNISVVLVRLQG